ncbi:MAG: hypothetical protein AUJ82_06720 [Verrucomicrobia bacterium CG1_02_43_26]|nr:MAG: hypothetical protein AUJ82_06720 [Verrucomicrobia bacterium CG1_02_43_26]
MFQIFRQEVDTHLSALQDGLLNWENNFSDEALVKGLMRAAHSMKGAAGIFGMDNAKHLAHAMEDFFVSVQKGETEPASQDIDMLLAAVDMLLEIPKLAESELTKWPIGRMDELVSLQNEIKARIAKGKTTAANQIVQTEQPETITAKPQSGVMGMFKSETRSRVKKIRETLVNIQEIPTALAKGIDAIRPSVEAMVNLAGIVNQEATAENAKRLIALLAAQNKEKPLDPNFLKAANDILDEIESTLSALETEPSITEISEKPKPIVPPAPKGVFSGRSAQVQKARMPTPNPFRKNSLQGTDYDFPIRVSAKSLNKIMALAAESMIEVKRLSGFRDGLLKLKQFQNNLSLIINNSLESYYAQSDANLLLHSFKTIHDNVEKYRGIIRDQLDGYDSLLKDYTGRTNHLYHEVLFSRMRPFVDRAHAFPRLVRDTSRLLGKKIRFELIGERTPVDREILEKLESPINHMLRNACDHGIESPAERAKTDKPEVATIQIEARHNAGMLLVEIRDDGHGIDAEKIRKRILDKGLVTPEMAETLTQDEVMEFLFLPGFSSAEKVTEISGRGVGLDVVNNLMQELGGTAKIKSELGNGTSIMLRMPITRSVIRTLLIGIDGECYAIPLSRIDRTLRIQHDQILAMENHQYFHLGDQNIGVVSAREVLGLESVIPSEGNIPVVLIGKDDLLYAIIVDQFLGETDLAVRPLDRRLGKVPCVSAAALTEDGGPVLIMDIDDLINNIDKLLSKGKLGTPLKSKKADTSGVKKVLVVDDSATVRETERQILEQAGFVVEVAQDGVDGWNTLRLGKFNLVVTDVDMPRMNGYEFVSLMRDDPEYKNIPVIMISYKDREEDYQKGLKSGVNLYLTKSSFRDDSFIKAVKELIL